MILKSSIEGRRITAHKEKITDIQGERNKTSRKQQMVERNEKHARELLDNFNRIIRVPEEKKTV